MEDMLYKKVRSAATAGWWTLLIAVGIAIIQGLAALWAFNVHPQWVSNVWGGISWDSFQNLLLWMIAILRILIMIIFLTTIWLTIWSARLRRMTLA